MSSPLQQQPATTIFRRFLKNPGFLAAHSRSHHSPSYGYHECSKCGKVLMTSSSLLSHIKQRHSKIRKIPCKFSPACQKSFVSKAGHVRHLQVIHDKSFGRPFFCSFCKKCFTQKSILYSHLRTHTGEKWFKCKLCGKKFSSSGNCKRHEDSHNKVSKKRPNFLEKRYNPNQPRLHECPICKVKKFTYKHELKKHLYGVHTLKEKHLKCPRNLCLYQTWSEDYLKHHLRRHDKTFQHYCYFCNKGFLTTGELLSHLGPIHNLEKIRKKIPKSMWKYQCTFCDKKYRSERDLKQHLIIHFYEREGLSTRKEMKPLPELPAHNGDTHKDVHCPRCPRQFSSIKSVNHHLSVSHKVSNRSEFIPLPKHVCGLCKKSFKEPNHLRKHVDAVHSNLKPHACDRQNCNAAYKSKPALYQHVKVSHGGFRAKCSHCEKTYSCNTTLKYHIAAKHPQGETPSRFSCIFCDQSFLMNFRLQRHIAKDHLNEESYQCGDCPKILFTKKSHLFHRLKYHNVIPELEKKATLDNESYLICCKKCPKRCKTVATFHRHYKRHFSKKCNDVNFFKNIESNPIFCYFCNQVLTNEKSLPSHLRRHTKEAPEQCWEPNCTRRFTTRRKLIGHLTRDHPGKNEYTVRRTLQCPHCPVMLINAVNYNFHLIKRHQISKGDSQLLPDPKYPCPSCPLVFKQKSAFETHKLLKHSSLRPLLCPVPGCDTTFRTRGHQNVHIKIIHEGHRMECNFCGKAFKSSNFGLLEHIRKVHNKERNYPCQICGKKLSSRSNLAAHISSVHTKLHKYFCDMCGDGHDVSFTSSTILSGHKMLHKMEDVVQVVVLGSGGGWKAKCKICNTASFTSHSGFLEHLKKHRIQSGELPEPEKRFECKNCFKKFPRNDYLKYHAKNCTVLKPFSCTKSCGKAFPNRLELEYHLRNPCSTIWKCYFCKYENTKSHNLLSIHFRVHSKEFHFKCRECGKRMYDSWGLKKHCKLVHGTNEIIQKDL